MRPLPRVFVQQGQAIAVADALEIAVGGASGIIAIASIALVGSSQVNTRAVLWLVGVKDSIPLVIARLADQPAEYALAISRIDNTGVGILAVNREDIVLGNGSPM